MREYASIDDLLDAVGDTSIHIECGTAMSEVILETVRERNEGTHDCAYLLAGEQSFGRVTVRDFLKLFVRISGSGLPIDPAIAHFGLADVAGRQLRKLTKIERALVDFARLSLMNPKVCFCERPLGSLEAASRKAVLTWMSEKIDKGVQFITTAEPLREALLMPGLAFWCDEDRFIAADVEQGEDSGVGNAVDPDALSDWEPGSGYAGDEVRVCKIPAKTETATLLLDPKDIDFVESINKANYVSVRGSLYQTSLTMDELEAELASFGFFRCHRSYIVNAQKVAKVERYTRNSFNLTLSDVAESSIPLAKGRAEEMRSRYGW